MSDFRDIFKQIKSTYKEYLEITAYPSIDLLPWQSKFGGLPFLPASISYPVQQDGTPLHLLAQFNFASMPKLDLFPQKGLLQFYIDQNPEDGSCFNDPTNPDSFRIIYIPEVNPYEPQHSFDFKSLPPLMEGFPIDPKITLALEFQKKVMPISCSDQKYLDVYEHLLSDKELEHSFEDFYSTFCDRSCGHKLGGYPFFCNGDPREPTEGYDFLLFQIEASEHVFLYDGVANFFINENKLKALDFTDVVYFIDSF